MIGRVEERSRLRTLLGTPGPRLTWVSGFRRSGRTTLIRHVTRDMPTVWIRGSEMPAELAGPDMALALREQLRMFPDAVSAAAPGDSDGPWTTTFAILQGLARLPDPPVLVVDRAEPLLQDRRFVRGMETLWSELRAHGRRQHLLFIDSDRHTPQGWTRGAEGDGVRPGGPTIEMGPLDLREAAAAVPEWSARECVAIHALVGGLPTFWDRVDTRLRPETALHRLILDPEGPCHQLALDLLPDAIRSHERSLALLRALGRGGTSWGELRRGAAVFRSSSELGPYVKGLTDAGLVRPERSLDAAPRSRSRRYRLVHPLHGFWFGSVHPRLPRLTAGVAPSRILSDAILPEVPTRVQRVLPRLVQDYLERHGEERFPTAAREVGAVWGDGYDLEVAATLHSGAAVYGHVSWSDAPPAPEAMDRLGGEIRQARYGFGRESRLRLLLVRDDPNHALARRTAQIRGAYLLTPRDLVGRA